MTDLVVLVPSRGRPANVARLIEACAKTCRADTILHFGFDADDQIPLAVQQACLTGKVRWTTESRMGLAAWTNYLALAHVDTRDTAPEHLAPYLASLGDDHVPVTEGWDAALIETIERNHGGIGFAYPNDRIRDDIPEAVVVSSAIVRALGWMANPACQHFYIDDTWWALGSGAGCITYRPDVIVEHRHHIAGAPLDATYTDANPMIPIDAAAYRRWRLTQMHKDVAKIKALRSVPCP